MFSYYSKQHKCKLFVSDDLLLLPLPCLFSDSLNQHLVVYSNDREDDLSDKNIEDVTAGFILNRLEQFLVWVEEYAAQSEFVSLDNHHNLPNELLNEYLNKVLIEEKGLGEASIKQSIQALTAYYNYLYKVGLTNNLRRLLIKPTFRSQARNNTKTRTCVKYLTPELRNIIYQNAVTIRDELLFKTGGECGLRSKENRGFLLADFRVGNKTYSGLLSLFDEMEQQPEKVEFEYYLQGIYTKAVRYKGGKSRKIFLHRSLLMRFKEYYDTERPNSNSNSFFLNNSQSGNTSPISANRATKAFREVCNKVIVMQDLDLFPPDGQLLEVDHTHHVLRHSFGTDKFYFYAEENNMAVDDVTNTSQVYLTVAALMGHNASCKTAPQTTAMYIRSCNIKDSFLLH